MNGLQKFIAREWHSRGERTAALAKVLDIPATTLYSRLSRGWLNPDEYEELARALDLDKERCGSLIRAMGYKPISGS